MNAVESDRIAHEVKQVSDQLARYTENAELDLLLGCYANSPDFRAFSGDGKMRTFDEFKNLCRQYYNNLKKQQVATTMEKFQVVSPDLVIMGWVLDIVAEFKNGDTMNMKDYAVTCVFKKTDHEWKVIHSHESGLPPEIIHGH